MADRATPESPFPWVVLPAAGRSERFAESPPKQYQLLRGVPVAEYSLRLFLSLPAPAIVVALARGDERWPSLPSAADRRVETVRGGDRRADSVFSALTHLQGRAGERDWVLVHDIARPCLRASWVARLMEALAAHPTGGLLAVPVSDQLWQVEKGELRRTLPRDGVYRAQTPQMFRYGLLYQALSTALQKGQSPRDEAEAVAAMGSPPAVVAGDERNLKITYPADLAYAEQVLEGEHESRPGL